jgi:hypothetical protein
MPTIAILSLPPKELRHYLYAENGTIRLAETSELPTDANTPPTSRGEHHPKQTLAEEAEMDMEAAAGAALASGDSPSRRYITTWLITRLEYNKVHQGAQASGTSGTTLSVKQRIGASNSAPMQN